MKALSLQQPYAQLIVERAYEDDPHVVLKPVENRSWPLPKTLQLPARIYVHASLTLYPVQLGEIRDKLLLTQRIRLNNTLQNIYNYWSMYKNEKKRLQRLGYFGCIIGEVTITGQVTESDSPWFFGPYGYTLVDPVKYSKPIPYKGAMGFFKVTIPLQNRPLEVSGGLE